MEQSNCSNRLSISAELLDFCLYGKKDNRGVERHYQRSVFTPSQLTIQPSTIPGSEYGVYSTTWIKPGTLFGPVIGRTVNTSNDLPAESGQASWEITDNNGHVTRYVLVDVTSWTAHVVCARHSIEQNLILMQRCNQLYYQATKLIRPGDELLVWYGPEYNLFMGIPDIEQADEAKPTTSDVNQVFDTDRSMILASKFHCVVCHRPFNSRSNLRSHMRIHTLERPFTCSFCQRAFSQSSTLRNHTRLHTGEKPYQCSACHSSYSQLAGLRAHQKSARHRHPVTSQRKNESE